jgi:hypothetical protein
MATPISFWQTICRQLNGLHVSQSMLLQLATSVLSPSIPTPGEPTPQSFSVAQYESGPTTVNTMDAVPGETPPPSKPLLPAELPGFD